MGRFIARRLLAAVPVLFLVSLITFGLLLIVSLDNALSYNLHHYRHMDKLADWSFSGWKVNLLFPQESRRPSQISAVNAALLASWIVVLIALLTAPMVMRWARARTGTLLPVTLHPRSIVAQAFAAAVLFVMLGSAVSAATGVWTRPLYLLPQFEAAQQAAVMVDEIGECALCLASTSGPLSTRRVAAALDSLDPRVVNRQRPSEEREYKRWLEMPGQIRAWYIEANGRPPTDSDLGHHLYQWREDHVPAVEIRRRIFTAAGKTP